MGKAAETGDEGLSEFEIERLEALRGTHDVVCGEGCLRVSVWRENPGSVLLSVTSRFDQAFGALMISFDTGYELAGVYLGDFNIARAFLHGYEIVD